MSTQNRAPLVVEIRAMELDREWGTKESHTEDLHGNIGPREDIAASTLPKRGERSGMGATTTEIIAVAGKDRGLLRHNSRGPYHTGAFIQDWMDHHEWDLESPSKGLGSHPRHANQDSGLM
jgi:hypothetical protein